MVNLMVQPSSWALLHAHVSRLAAAQRAAAHKQAAARLRSWCKPAARAPRQRSAIYHAPGTYTYSPSACTDTLLLAASAAASAASVRGSLQAQAGVGSRWGWRGCLSARWWAGALSAAAPAASTHLAPAAVASQACRTRPHAGSRAHQHPAAERAHACTLPPTQPPAPTHKPVAAMMPAARCGSLHVRRKSTTALSFTPSGTACCPLRLRCFQSAAAAASPPPDATEAEASPEAAEAVLRARGLALALAADRWKKGHGRHAVGKAGERCCRRRWCHHPAPPAQRPPVCSALASRSSRSCRASACTAMAFFCPFLNCASSAFTLLILAGWRAARLVLPTLFECWL